MGTQILSSVLEQGLSKDLRLSWEMHFNLDTLNSKKFSGSAWNHIGGPLIPLKYTVDICTGMPIKTLGMTLLTLPFY